MTSTILKCAAAVGLMAALAGGGVAHAAPQDAASASQELYEKLDGLVDRIGSARGACTEDQIAALRGGIADKLFPTVDSPMRAKVLTVTLFCDVNDPDPKHNDPEEAAGLARQLEPIAKDPEEIGMANMVLFYYGLDKGKVEADRFARLLDVWPEGVAGLSAEELGDILYTAHEKDAKAGQTLLAAVLAAPWEQPDIKQAVNNDWALDYAYMLADQKDMAGVRAAIARMDEPGDLITIASDRRFEPLWDELEARGKFNWAIHGKAVLDDALAAAVDDPDHLGPAISLMYAFYHQNHFAEALPLGAMWRTKIKSGAEIPDRANADLFLDIYGTILVSTGKLDEAGQVYAEATAAGDDKVSHATHWGQSLVSAGQADAGLKVFTAIDRTKATPKGAAWIDAGIVCANAKDHAAEAVALATKMAGQWKDNSSAVEMALVCANRTEAAADLYVKRFADKDERASALDAVRTGPPAVDATPWDLDLDKRKQAVLAMPKVVKALNAVGRRVAAPVELSSVGSF